MQDDVLSDIIEAAERIEREKSGKALTEDEAKTLEAVAFLRQIAPWAFPDIEHKREKP